MHLNIDVALALIGLTCFVIAALGWFANSKINFLALGLAFWIATVLW